MFYFSFEAIPKHNTPQAAELGGAYVNCWLKGGSRREAELKARALIDAAGWIVGSKEDEATVERADYADRPESLARFDQAQLHGSCVVFHTYPLGEVATFDDDEDLDEDSGDQEMRH